MFITVQSSSSKIQSEIQQQTDCVTESYSEYEQRKKKLTMIASILFACFMVASCHEEDQAVRVAIDAAPAAGEDRELLQPAPLDVILSRHKRATPSCGISTALTSAQQTESVSAHNYFRSQETAGDSLQMSWDDNLAAQAQAWAQQCKWEHGMLNDCSGNSIGQNLFMAGNGTNYPPVNITSAVSGWAGERQDWNFTSGTCLRNRVCGHWTQVVWSKSYQVGCGYARCPKITTSTGSVWLNALIVACDYSPAGNYVNELPFRNGSRCSSCSAITRLSKTNRGYLAACPNNLCVPCNRTSTSDALCTCGTPDVCINGGTWNALTCSCNCAAGYFGSTCQTKCVDLSTGCSQWLGLGYCNVTSIYYAFMKDNCASTCSLCY